MPFKKHNQNIGKVTQIECFWFGAKVERMMVKKSTHLLIKNQQMVGKERKKEEKNEISQKFIQKMLKSVRIEFSIEKVAYNLCAVEIFSKVFRKNHKFS